MAKAKNIEAKIEEVMEAFFIGDYDEMNYKCEAITNSDEEYWTVFNAALDRLGLD